MDYTLILNRNFFLVVKKNLLLIFFIFLTLFIFKFSNLNNLIFICIFLPIICIICLFFMPYYDLFLLRNWSLNFSLFSLINSFFLFLKFTVNNSENFLISFQWENLIGEEPINVFTNNFTFAINNISILFIILTNLLIVICILITWNWTPYFYSIKSFILLLFLIQFFCTNFFMASQLLIFYIFFESVLIPMYLLIGIWGLRDRKVHASYQFFLYTFFGSLFLLFGLIVLGGLMDSYDMNYLSEYWWFSVDQNIFIQIFLWFCIFMGFAIKIPMVPFHIWLPEAHVEAPTAGSIILAGILLKFGTYGFYKILIQLLPLATLYVTKLVICISLLSIFYASLITYAQIDLKKIIAYSSVSHMGYVTLGLVLDNIEGVAGAIYMMLTHGLISGGLFYIVGILYERYGTRNIYYYGGLKNIMPKYVFVFFLLTLANINLPLTGGFVSEFLVLIGTGMIESKIIGFLAAFGLVTNGVYCIWLFNRLCMGENIIKTKGIMEYKDLDKREEIILYIFIIFILLMGIFPNGVLNVIENSVYNILWGRQIYF